MASLLPQRGQSWELGSAGWRVSSLSASYTEGGVLETGQLSISRGNVDASQDSLEHLLGCHDVSAQGEGMKGGSKLQPAMSWRCEFSNCLC